VPVDVGPDCMALIEKAANRLEAAVQTGRFEAGTAETDPTAPCERCSFRAFCPAAAPKET
jgi:hypothetical protein